MEKIINLANEYKYKYNSLEYVEPEDIANATIYTNTKENMMLYQKSSMKEELYWESKSKDNIQLFWASQSKESFLKELIKTIDFIKQNEIKAEKIYMEFIPEDFLNELNNLGFKIVSEWVDYWNTDLNSLDVEVKREINIRSLNSDEITIAGEITRSCIGYSRGFAGESDEVIKEWSESDDSCLFVAEIDNKLVGVCFVKLYGFDSEKGTVLWIREVSVDPKYQSRGIGREMMNYGIKWGIKNGAKRSFLACDAENFNALKLYESLNYKRKEERGQINMELWLNKGEISMENKSIEIKKNITDLFNKVSTVFDSNGPRYFEYFGRGLVEFAAVKEGQTVLDVASGKGASLFAAAEKVRANGKVIGSDIAEGMVKETNLEIQRRAMKNVEVMVMDAEKLDFTNETFDHILCGFGVFFFPNYKVAFNEFMRVLKEGGRFSFTTFLRKSDEKFSWFHELVEKYLPPFQDELDEYQEDDAPEFHTEEGLYKILKKAGFKNTQVINEEKIFVYKDEQEWWDKLWTHGFIDVLERIPEHKMEDFKAEVFEKLREIKGEKGIAATIYVLYALGEK
jgi:ubiquinone/menaquinone biosynthesis C-methylase UbiE/ribosomal protein S18 acetylase RimI-like enzyme